MENNIKNNFIWNILGSIVIAVIFSALSIYFLGAEVFQVWKKITSGIVEVTIVIVLVIKCFSFIHWYLAIDGREEEFNFYEIIVKGYTITIVISIIMLDIILYPHYNVVVLYTLVVPFGWFLPSKYGTIKAAAWAILLCLMSFVFISNSGDFDVFFLNRLSSIVVIAMVGIFLMYFKKNKYKLNQINSILSRRNIETELKSKELEQYIYTVSHDLKEPLRSLSVILDIFMKSNKSKIEGEDLELLGLVKDSTLKMGNSIDAVLDYSKLGQDFNLEKVDLNKLVKDVFFDIDDSLKVDTNLEIEELGNLNVYVSDFNILLSNLIKNALTYRSKKETCEISISRKDKGDFAFFYISDNGIGIEKENHERIFKIFQTLKKSDSEKKGLGLAHCRKIVELHKGNIIVKSRLNLGSTFIFKISKSLKQINITT